MTLNPKNTKACFNRAVADDNGAHGRDAVRSYKRFIALASTDTGVPTGEKPWIDYAQRRISELEAGSGRSDGALVSSERPETEQAFQTTPPPAPLEWGMGETDATLEQTQQAPAVASSTPSTKGQDPEVPSAACEALGRSEHASPVGPSTVALTDGDADARQVEEALTGLTMVSEPLAPAAAPAKSPGAKRATGSVYRKGDRIAERIEVLEMLGRGGFGVVYLVEISDVTGTGALNIATVETHECALKTFRDEYMADPQVRERFRHEAQMLVDLGRHPYLLYCQGVYEIGGQLYIATEHLSPNINGLNSLEGYLRHDPPDLAQSLRWGIQCCHGMEYAYGRGLRCHRDLKPANILIAQDRTVRVADFGLAGVLDQSRLADGIQVHVANGRVGLSGQTLTGAGLGTPTHMPPEQFTDAVSCDERSDVYAFGVVLYQMATGGQLPVRATLPRDPSPAEKIRFWDEMLRLKTVNDIPQLDSPLLPIIKHCLATQPSERYRSFRELREALESLLLRQTGEVVEPPMVHGLSTHDWCTKDVLSFVKTPNVTWRLSESATG